MLATKFRDLSRFHVVASLLVVPLLGALLLLWMGRNQGAPATSTDSATYVSIGHNLLNGRGFSTFLTRWDTSADVTHIQTAPPGYPFLIAAVELVGLDPKGHDLLVVNAALLFVTLLFTCAIAHRLTGTVTWAWLAGLLVLTGSFVTTVHLYIWSEPLFIALLMGGCAGLLSYMQTGRRLALGLSALSMGLMWLTRYAGVGIVMPSIALVALAGDKPISMRLRRTFVYALIACLPIGLWFLHNALTADEAVWGHALTWEPVTTNLKLLLVSMTGGFNLRRADKVTDIILISILLITVPSMVSTWQHWYRHTRNEHEHLNRTTLTRYIASPIIGLGMLIVSYGIFIFVWGTVANTDIDARKLAPIWPLFVVLCIACISYLIQGHSAPRGDVSSLLMLTGVSSLTLFSQPIHAAVYALSVVAGGLVLWYIWHQHGKPSHTALTHTATLLVVCIFIFNHINRWVHRGTAALQSSRDFSAKSEVVGWLKENANGKVLYTDSERALYFSLDDAKIKLIPCLDEAKLAICKTEADNAEFPERVAESGGYVVIMGSSRSYLVPEEQLVADGRLIMIQNLEDGRIYRAR